MKRLTKTEFETIYLYGLGLTFDEISLYLNCNSRGIYNNDKRKDHQRVMRAKDKRIKNTSLYRLELKQHLKDTKECNKRHLNNYHTQWALDHYIIPLDKAKEGFRKIYIDQCLELSFKKYHTYKMRFIKKVA